jgi:hypothetical protein
MALEDKVRGRQPNAVEQLDRDTLMLTCLKRNMNIVTSLWCNVGVHQQ